MRFVVVVVLLGCIFHLAFAKAQVAGDETFLDKAELEPEAEEAFLEDVSEPEEQEDAKPDERLKSEAFLEDVSETDWEEDGKLDEYLKPDENDKRGAFFLTEAPPIRLASSTRPRPPTRPPTRPPFRYSITIPVGIPPVNGKRFFKLCYCFKKKCDVAGMYPGFKGWEKRYLTGYVVVGKTLYYFYPCRPGIIPKPTKEGTPKPPMTRMG